MNALSNLPDQQLVAPYNASGVDKELLFVTRVESRLDKEHIQWPPGKRLSCCLR